MPSKEEYEPRRKSSSTRRRRSSYGFGGERSSSRRRHSDWDLDFRTSHTPELEPVQRDVYKTRTGASPRPSFGRRTYSRDSGFRTVSESSSSSRRRRKVYNVVDLGMERRASASRLSGTRSASIPYPSFSKAHSRESVVPRDDAAGSSPRRSPYATESSDYAQGNSRSSKPSTSPLKGTSGRSPFNGPAAPPSPPLTAEGSNIRRVHSGSNIKRDADAALRFSASRISLRDAEEGRSSNGHSREASNVNSKSLHPGDPVSGPASGDVSPRTSSTPTRGSPTRKSGAAQRSSISRPTDSDATPMVQGKGKNAQPPTLLSHRGATPPSESESFPRTPNDHDPQVLASESGRKETPVIEVLPTGVSASEMGPTSGESFSANDVNTVPPPPPPPPPLDVPTSGIPKVDYLLQNGGLAKQITKRFVAAGSSHPPIQSYQQYMSPPTHSPKPADAHAPFAAYHTLLDDMEKVMTRNGSIAVATGYKSVARRLLDRLETVFARNISSQLCSCVMCKQSRQESKSPAADTGVSWGEVLELVSGRRELPPWPPFSLPTSAAGLGLSSTEQKPPMQKLDIDVPEEYRDHYIRQSKKTKQAVDKWLATQPEDQPSPPTEVDDETLTFTMLTYLEPAQRRLFTALIRGLSTIPDARAPTPAAPEPKADLMSKVGTALERLYRLPRPPREPESAMYLLNNPGIHSALATLAAISNQEWEILVSGRFDGFLVSGAEHQFPSMGPIGSRGVTPAPRGTTPYGSNAPSSYAPPSSSRLRNGSFSTPVGARIGSNANTGYTTPTVNPNSFSPGPVQLDEETEIAVLAEVEREIYLGMEALEDAFEALHLRAEVVRRSLRERGAGLSLQARAMGRRGSEKELDARLGTPFDGAYPIGTPGPSWGFSAASTPAIGVVRGGDSDDDGLDDVASLAPDDSASNVGWKDRKHRHHRRRRPRRTPAPVDEVSE